MVVVAVAQWNSLPRPTTTRTDGVVMVGRVVDLLCLELFYEKVRRKERDETEESQRGSNL